MPTTAHELQRQGEVILKAAGITSARLDSLILLERATKKPREWLIAHGDDRLGTMAAQEFMDAINRRSQRVPLVHLTNSRQFYGLDLYVDERVLTPRVETETMAAYAIQHAPRDSRLIDIGTGSGALAIAIKKHRPDLIVTATDVADEALAVARRNIKRHQLDITLARSDLLQNVTGTFETVVTNLPYLRDDADLMPEVQKEPAVALFGGLDGLELYREFLRQLPSHLESGGLLFTECDPWQHQSLISEAAEAGLRPILQDDYFILGFRRE